MTPLVDRPDQRAVMAVDALRRRGWTVATAESLTAGLLASTIAEVPGASAVLRGGLIVYATDLKAALAGVPTEVLDRHGAVSPETARALADAAAARCGADVGIGLTGVAGPDQQEGQPVGTVHVGLRVPGADARVVSLRLAGGRARIRSAACTAALEMLTRAARSEVGPEDGNESGAPGVVPQ